MKWLIMGFLCCIGLASCEKASEPIPNANAAETPTEILKDFVMNDVKHGIKTMTLISKEGRIYEAKHISEVDQPLIYFYKEGKESSRLNAPKGLVQMESHDVDTWGGVTVVSSDSSTLTTERLHYDAKLQKIFSKDPVRLEKPDSITDGIGLETDPQLKTVKIGRQTVHMKKGLAH